MGQRKNCAFHLDGDKKPVYLAYLKKNQCFPNEFDNVKLDTARLERKSEEIVLGLYRKVRPIDAVASVNTSHGKMIDTYGYECQWNLSKLKSIAYRLQRIKYTVVPQFLKKLVSAYFCGVLRFSSSVIWLRSLPKHINNVRFYYCMALAASLGLTVAEALNLSCCKTQSVSKDNSYYQRLLQETGLSSLEEMACLDAVSVTKQVHLLKPEWFLKGTARQQARARLHKQECIAGVIPSLNKTLISEIYKLRQMYFSDFKPIRDEIIKTKDLIREEFKKKMEKVDFNKKNYTKLYKQELLVQRKRSLAMADTPCLEYYFEAVEFCKTGSRINYAHLIRTYTLRSRYEFDCLDAADRVSNYKTPSRQAPSDAPDLDPSEASTPRKANTQQCKTINTVTRPIASSQPPGTKKKRGRPKKITTNGFITTSKKRTKPSDDTVISNISGFHKTMSASKRALVIAPCNIWTGPTSKCRYCGTNLFTNVFNRNGKRIPSESHLLFECKGIPNSDPLPKSNRRHPKGLMARLAAISAVPDPGGDIV